MMSMLRWMGLTFARFVGLAVALLGGWLVLGQAIEPGPVGRVVALIVVFGVIGLAGGVLYLLSYDGPAAYRTRRVRVLGWVGMLISAMLPTSLRVMVVSLVLLVSPTLFLSPSPAPEETVTSE